MNHLRILWVLVFALLPGCIAFNDVCEPDKSEVVGETLVPLSLLEQELRTQEARVGNLLADAMLAELPSADLAVVPAVAFNRNTACGPREVLDRGPLKLGDVEQLLPGNESIVLLSVTTEDLKEVLERSVSVLGAAREPGQAPYFLQVGRLSFTVDCAGSPQILNEGSNTIVFTGDRILPLSLRVGDVQPEPGQTLKLATLSNLSQGAYGYTTLAKPGRLLSDTKKPARQVLADFLRQRSPVEPQIQGRIELSETCNAK